MRYLLDSTALIEFSKGIEPTQTHILTLIESGHTVGLCGVTVAEFYAGQPHGQNPVMDRFIDRLPCWDISRDVGRLAGDYRYSFLHQHKKKLPTADTLIAAVARRQHAVLLTNNTRDFPMTNIAVERLGP